MPGHFPCYLSTSCFNALSACQWSQQLWYDNNGVLVKKVAGGVTTVYIGSHYEKQGGTVIKYTILKAVENWTLGVVHNRLTP